LRQWHERYAGRGLTIVGVHAPEFTWERKYEKVVDATKKFRLLYPVVQDNDFAIWKRFGVWAWPTKILIDKRGVARDRHVGEGAYAETEALIQTLLGEGA
jgi:hypothetical protein